jgi:hypothetical protein
MAKIFRSFQVLNNIRVSSRYISAASLLLFVGILVAINVILLIILEFFSGIADATVVQSQTDFLYNYVQCRVNNLQFQTILIVIIFIIDGLATIVTAVLAIYTRRVESPYGENRFIAFALYDFVVVLGVLIPIYYTGNDGVGSVSRQYILRSLGILFVLIFTLLVISLPKIISISKTASEEDSVDRGSVSSRSSNLTEATSGGIAFTTSSGKTNVGASYPRSSVTGTSFMTSDRTRSGTMYSTGDDLDTSSANTGFSQSRSSIQPFAFPAGGSYTMTADTSSPRDESTAQSRYDDSSNMESNTTGGMTRDDDLIDLTTNDHADTNTTGLNIDTTQTGTYDDENTSTERPTPMGGGPSSPPILDPAMDDDEEEDESRPLKHNAV